MESWESGESFEWDVDICCCCRYPVTGCWIFHFYTGERCHTLVYVLLLWRKGPNRGQPVYAMKTACNKVVEQKPFPYVEYIQSIIAWSRIWGNRPLNPGGAPAMQSSKAGSQPVFPGESLKHVSDIVLNVPPNSTQAASTKSEIHSIPYYTKYNDTSWQNMVDSFR